MREAAFSPTSPPASSSRGRTSPITAEKLLRAVNCATSSPPPWRETPVWMSMTGSAGASATGGDLRHGEVRTVEPPLPRPFTRGARAVPVVEPRIRGSSAIRCGAEGRPARERTEWGKLGAGLRVNDELLRSFLGEAKRIREEHGIAARYAADCCRADLFQTAPVGAIPRAALACGRGGGP